MTLAVDTTVTVPTAVELARVHGACAALVNVTAGTVNYPGAVIANVAAAMLRRGLLPAHPENVAGVLAELATVHERMTGGDESSDALRLTAAYLRHVAATAASRQQGGLATTPSGPAS
jgi:hypothetical protein